MEDPAKPMVAACCYSCQSARDAGCANQLVLRCTLHDRDVYAFNICETYRPASIMCQVATLEVHVH